MCKLNGKDYVDEAGLWAGVRRWPLRVTDKEQTWLWSTASAALY